MYSFYQILCPLKELHSDWLFVVCRGQISQNAITLGDGLWGKFKIS